MKHLVFHILLIISIAHLEMLNFWRNRMTYVTHIAIHKHKNWYKFFHILNGLYMAILLNKEMDGLGTPGHGSLMWGPSLAGCISTRYNSVFAPKLSLRVHFINLFGISVGFCFLKYEICFLELVTLLPCVQSSTLCIKQLNA